MYDQLPARLPVRRLAALESAIPGIDLLGLGEPLHSYVCELSYGGAGKQS